MHFLVSLILTAFYLLHSLALDIDLPSLSSLNDGPVAHLTIKRRGGSFETFIPGVQNVNLTELAQELVRIEKRYSLTKREVKGNKLVRKPRAEGIGGSDNSLLMSEVARNGTWFAEVRIGTPPQSVELDLDLLSSDFYVFTTTSRAGSRFDDLFSSTIKKSSMRSFPGCTTPSDQFYLPSISSPSNIQFAHCRPSKSSIRTLSESGSMLGLAASTNIAQINSPSLISQLIEQNIIKLPIFSITLLNGHEGVLSLGGSVHKAVEAVEESSKAALDRLVSPSEPSNDGNGRFSLNRRGVLDKKQQPWDEAFKWTGVQGAEGWWQILMRGVWVGERKVLKNQPVVVDINTPVIIAPPTSAAIFYSSISGAYALAAPHTGMYAFPCLNPPSLALEFGGWNFPVFRTSKGADHLGRSSWGRPGGQLSLGRLKQGSGYCVGSIVGLDLGNAGASESEKSGRFNMDVEAVDKTRMRAGARGKSAEVSDNGMRGVWVVGEPWLRGVTAVFDLKEQRVGFRST